MGTGGDSVGWDEVRRCRGLGSVHSALAIVYCLGLCAMLDTGSLE